jgi:hypothetical protein
MMRFVARTLVVPCVLAAQGPALKGLDQAEVNALAPKVRSIKAEPRSITLHVGQSVSFDKINVAVIDSSGKTRGRLIGYDFAIKPGEPAKAVPRQVTGVRPGTTELRIMYPTSAWKVRRDSRAEARVKIVVVK